MKIMDHCDHFEAQLANVTSLVLKVNKGSRKDIVAFFCLCTNTIM